SVSRRVVVRVPARSRRVPAGRGDRARARGSVRPSCDRRRGAARHWAPGAAFLTYSWPSTDQTLKQASAGIAGGASRVCLVASGRKPSDHDFGRVTDMVTGLKDADRVDMVEKS